MRNIIIHEFDLQILANNIHLSASFPAYEFPACDFSACKFPD